MQVRFEPPINAASANAAATAAGSKLLSEAEATPCKQMNLLPDTLIKVQQVRNSRKSLNHAIRTILHSVVMKILPEGVTKILDTHGLWFLSQQFSGYPERFSPGPKWFRSWASMKVI